jgi:mRNA-degrading endonuclease RelE of RelBE toxin-antitoxin system
MVSIKWSADALEDLERIDVVVARRIIEKAKWLEDNFSDVVPEKLHHDLRKLYKLRVGDYRAVYSIHGDVIIIQALGHRKDIYQ